jgi:hypothetical protein
MNGEPLYATPVHGTRLAVRAAPATPLLVYPMEQQVGRAQLFVTQPASWPALTAAEVRPLRAYFDWETRDGYWWRTLRPAVVAMEEVTTSLWSAVVEERGVVVSAGDDPRFVPDASNVFRTFVPAGRVIRDPHGPELVADECGNTEVLRTSALHVYRARFPALGPEIVWLRVFAKRGERDAHLRALASELDVIRRIAVLDADLAPAVLHEGRLDATFHTGRYVAMRQPIGLALHEVIVATGRSLFGAPARIVRGAALDVCRTMMLAHAVGVCLGPLSPDLLRIRPSFGGRQTVRAMLVAMPGAGPPGGRLPPSVTELFPDGGAAPLLAEFDEVYERDMERDLVGLGHLLEWMLSIALVNDSKLARLAAMLRAGEVSSADSAFERLSRLTGV